MTLRHFTLSTGLTQICNVAQWRPRIRKAISVKKRHFLLSKMSGTMSLCAEIRSGLGISNLSSTKSKSPQETLLKRSEKDSLRRRVGRRRAARQSSAMASLQLSQEKAWNLDRRSPADFAAASFDSCIRSPRKSISIIPRTTSRPKSRHMCGELSVSSMTCPRPY